MGIERGLGKGGGGDISSSALQSHPGPLADPGELAALL